MTLRLRPSHCAHLILCLITACLLERGAPAQRLPANVQPQHYALALAPDLKTASFRGEETIDVILARPAAEITLNALELKIESVSVAGQNRSQTSGQTGTQAEMQTGEVTYDPAKEQATFHFGRALPAGAASLKIAYTGILNGKLHGFYLSKTKARNYAVTQFESTDARRAFPSFDEPALKATFDVSLTVDSGDMAISNTDVLSDTPAGPGKHTLVFRTTPRMSTYLVAFLVGDFGCSTGKAQGVPIRVCSTPDKVELTRFALKAAEHLLKYYDHYFGIKYPMPKLDLIGIPDFEAGAMENFGAITYRETELLVDEKDSSVNSRKRVASVVAHEMAHQWFGDMVTMQWWDNLWLNEGFATWMQDKAAAEWHPEWNYPQDVADDLDSTLNYDSVRTTRTIRARADTPAQIAEMFDGIAYGKAGAVIGMVEHYVGEDLFREGVHNYLQAHLYANATAEDFWNAQTASSHLPVDRIMASFIDKPGVPLLAFQDQAETGYPVMQTRFLLGGENEKDQQGAARHEEGPASPWVIPICLKGGAGCQLVQSPASIVVAKGSSATSPLFANADGKGYYRTDYTPGQLRAITAVAETGLTVPERIAFLGDRWALTRAGKGAVGDYLDLVLALKDDPNASVLDKALSSINQIRNRIASKEDTEKLNAVVRTQFGPVYAALGKDRKHGSLDEKQIRTDLFVALGDAGDPDVLAHALAITKDYFAQKRVTEPDIVDASVALTAQHGTEEFYETLQRIGEAGTDPGLTEETMQLLTRFESPILVIRTLEYAVSGKVRNQDAWILIALELSQPATRDLAWAWVQQHWDKVKAQLTTSSGGNLVSATGSFCTASQREEVQQFFSTHPVEAADRTLAKALESIDDCVELHTAQEPGLHAWLATHAP